MGGEGGEALGKLGAGRTNTHLPEISQPVCFQPPHLGFRAGPKLTSTQEKKEKKPQKEGSRGWFIPMILKKTGLHLHTWEPQVTS